MRRRVSIRTWLTLVYTTIFSGILVLYMVGAGALHYWQLNDQLYREEVQDEETVEGLLYIAPDGRMRIRDDYHGKPESKLLLDRLLEVLDLNGHVLFRNERLNGTDLGGSLVPHEVTRGYFARQMKLGDGRDVLAITHLHPMQGRWILIRLAYSTDPLRTRLVEFLAALAMAMPVALIAAAFGGYRAAGHVLNPLDNMARLAGNITANKLSERVPVENPNDEFGHMAQVLNALLERLEGAFNRMKRFTSDVSHELRTPLASLRSVGEVGLERNHTPAEYREIIGSMLEEVSRLSVMTDALLTIAHADSGEVELHRTVFPVSELVLESLSVVGVLAEEKNQIISVAGGNAISVCADRGLLRMALINLLDNAVKYSPTGGAIRVRWDAARDLTAGERLAELIVEDNGPGIPAAERHRVFDRFYRVDEGRAREAGGAGLGLAIAKWAVEVHGGEVMLDASEGGGTRFSITLPMSHSQAPART